jgi:hypothetical protein
VLVGGHAVAGHGEPRLTEDLDIFVDVSVVNAKRLRRVLLDFGFGEHAPSIEELAQPGKIWMLGRKPWRIDLLTEIDGVTFRDVWRSHVAVDFGSSPLPVIGLGELIKNKRAAGRPKDLADVAALERLQRATPTKRQPHKSQAPGTKNTKKASHSAALEDRRTKRRRKR